MDGASARYDALADFYVDLFGDAVDDPATVALLDLVGDVGGRRVLDLACGHGRVTRELARRGGVIVGVDVSRELIERARLHEDRCPRGISYLVDDASAPSGLTASSYDVVACNYGLSDIDDLDGVLATVARVLVADGTFVFSILHPCFPGWGTNVSGSWPKDRGYYGEGWWLSDAASSGIRRRVGANHRMLSTYLNALAAHGLVVDRVLEPGPDWTTWRSDQPDREPVPVFLAARCRLTSDSDRLRISLTTSRASNAGDARARSTLRGAPIAGSERPL